MAFTFYNMMSCSGFSAAIGGGCSIAWVGLVLAVFVIMISRKWIFEELLQQDVGIPQFIISIVATIIAYFIIIGFSGSFKWATAVGMIVGLITMYLSNMVTGGGDGGGANEF